MAVFLLVKSVCLSGKILEPSAILKKIIIYHVYSFLVKALLNFCLLLQAEILGELSKRKPGLLGFSAFPESFCKQM
mgnify:CR=1 FL=1